MRDPEGTRGRGKTFPDRSGDAAPGPRAEDGGHREQRWEGSPLNTAGPKGACWAVGPAGWLPRALRVRGVPLWAGCSGLGWAGRQCWPLCCPTCLRAALRAAVLPGAAEGPGLAARLQRSAAVITRLCPVGRVTGASGEVFVVSCESGAHEKSGDWRSGEIRALVLQHAAAEAAGRGPPDASPGLLRPKVPRVRPPPGG